MIMAVYKKVRKSDCTFPFSSFPQYYDTNSLHLAAETVSTAKTDKLTFYGKTKQHHSGFKLSQNLVHIWLASLQ